METQPVLIIIHYVNDYAADFVVEYWSTSKRIVNCERKADAPNNSSKGQPAEVGLCASETDYWNQTWTFVYVNRLRKTRTLHELYFK